MSSDAQKDYFKKSEVHNNLPFLYGVMENVSQHLFYCNTIEVSLEKKMLTGLFLFYD